MGKGENRTSGCALPFTLYPFPFYPYNPEPLLALRNDLLSGGVAAELIDDGAEGWREASSRR